MKVKNNFKSDLAGTNMLNTWEIFVKMNIIILYLENFKESHEKFLWNLGPYFLKIKKKLKIYKITLVNMK